jgi:uncharacterized protein
VLKPLLLAAFLCFALPAGADVAVPPIARVTDLTGTLKPGQKQGLDAKLEDFEKRKGSQLAVLMLPTTKPEAIEQYALRVVETWKLGRQGMDDGALFIVAKDDRAMRIEVGRGLEGSLTDVTSKRIISEVVAPKFREGDFAGGIDAGVDRMIAVIDGEKLPPPATRAGAQEKQDPFAILPVLLVAALVIGGLLRAMLGRFLGAGATGGAVGFIAWLLAGTLLAASIAGVLAFVFTLLTGGMRGGRGGFPIVIGGRGSGGSWGGGGGGFSGGGGSFGGGGASGNW